MTELHPRAKSLIRLARAGQEPSAEQLRQVMQGFEHEVGARSLPHVSRFAQKAQRGDGGGSNLSEAEKHRLNRKADVASWTGDLAHQLRRRLLKWSLLAAIMTGSVGAFANWGPDLPVLSAMAEQVKTTIDTVVTTVIGKGRSIGKDRTLGNARADGANSVDLPGAPSQAVALGAPVAPEVVAIEASPSVSPTPRVMEASLVASTTGGSPVRGASNAVSTARYNAPSPGSGVAVSEAAPTTVNPSTAQESVTAKGPSAFSEAEVNLIAAARSALAAGNYAQTRRLLDEHRISFARGALSEERETLRALVACRENGDTSLAQRYLARRPQSLFAARLTRECGLPTPPAKPLP